MVVFEKLELARGVSAEGSGGREGSGLEGFNVLVGVAVYHAIHQRVFAILELDIFGGFHFATREANVEGNVVRSFVQVVPLRDLRSWSIIFPSSPRVSLLPFVGWSSSAICSW